MPVDFNGEDHQDRGIQIQTLHVSGLVSGIHNYVVVSSILYVTDTGCVGAAGSR